MNRKVALTLKRLILTSPIDSFDEVLFNSLALILFESQFKSIESYRRYCLDFGVRPQSVAHWSEIPPIPSLAYKYSRIVSNILYDPSFIYHTSGTSDSTPGIIYRSKEAEAICRLAQLRAHREFVLPEGNKMIFYSLVPPSSYLPHSAAVRSINMRMRLSGTEESRSFFKEQGVDYRQLQIALKDAQDKEYKVALHGSTTSWFNFFQICRNEGHSFRLPYGSRINHGGGNKSQLGEFSPDKFRQDAELFLGIPQFMNINVLGMTELGSQFYDNTLRSHYIGRDTPRVKSFLPWTRTLVVDPVSLKPVSKGEIGILIHFDLSLTENILALQTEDLGYLVEEGFEIVGRMARSEQRGCFQNYVN
jgi:hypothetical protein